MDINKTVQLIEIKEERSGQRLDNWLFSLARNVPKSRIYRAIRKGEVRVNGKRAKAEYKLNTCDQVRVPPLYQSTTAKPVIKIATVEWLLTCILYEDAGVLIINKPAGIAVHGGTNNSFGIIEALRQARPAESFELVHRLDKQTSGCLIIAKNRLVLRQLHHLLREGGIDKQYVCLVKGIWQKKRQLIELPLRKNTLRSGERVVQADTRGKMAITEFNLIETIAQASLLEAKLHTGRMHQIRVHLQQIQYPIAGDGKYGDRLFNKQMHAFGLKRLFLHAQRLKFRLPDAAKAITVAAPLAEDLEQCLNRLR